MFFTLNKVEVTVVKYYDSLNELIDFVSAGKRTRDIDGLIDEFGYNNVRFAIQDFLCWLKTNKRMEKQTKMILDKECEWSFCVAEVVHRVGNLRFLFDLNEKYVDFREDASFEVKLETLNFVNDHFKVKLRR